MYVCTAARIVQGAKNVYRIWCTSSNIITLTYITLTYIVQTHIALN